MLLPAPTLAEEPAERPLHGLGDVDAFVAGDSPGSLDAMFGGLAGAGGQTATQFGQASSRHPQGWGNQFGQGFDLAFPQPDAYMVIQRTTSVNFLAVPSIGSGGTGRPFLNMYERDTSGAPPFFLHFFQPTPPRCLQEDFGGTAMFPAPRAKLGMGQHRLGQAAHGNPFAQTCPLRG
jgi:hypothetical protein